MSRILPVTVMACALLLASCAETIPPEALQLSHESLQERQAQTRRFETTDEKKLLVAGAQALQDLGFTLEDSETKLGVITGSKDRDATEAGQVAGAVMLALLFRVNTGWDDHQKIRASLVTHIGNGKETSVRVTFQRIVWNTKGRISKVEALDDPQLYQVFFDKLSQSVFLTAQEI